MANKAISLKINPKSDLERWREAGYAAIDRLIDTVGNQIEGKDVEDLSHLLREEGKNVTAAVFEQMINSLGKEALSAKSCLCPECGKILGSPQQTTRKQKKQ